MTHLFLLILKSGADWRNVGSRATRSGKNVHVRLSSTRACICNESATVDSDRMDIIALIVVAQCTVEFPEPRTGIAETAFVKFQ